ncbi:WhiB family transcriptional regulator (plasmid) [Kitasatospora sp. NBC_00070]|uniref:WhiB family transcriptional regulator n=1 Tax=Kitasatospora sp. NBC_00070 TaxID=2975962 RepID=UPI002F919DC9
MPIVTYRARPMTGVARTATSTTSTPASPVRPCRQVDPELFFPVPESRTAQTPTDRELIALAVCARCPLPRRQTCLTQQLAYGPTAQWGVVGGTTAAQRRELLRADRRVG